MDAGAIEFNEEQLDLIETMCEFAITVMYYPDNRGDYSVVDRWEDLVNNPPKGVKPGVWQRGLRHAFRERFLQMETKHVMATGDVPVTLSKQAR